MSKSRPVGLWDDEAGAEFHKGYLERKFSSKSKDKVIRTILEVDPLERRKCLTCGFDFPSWGSGNRICDPCKELSVNHISKFTTDSNTSIKPPRKRGAE